MLLNCWEILAADPAKVRYIALDLSSEQPATLLDSVLDGLHRSGTNLSDDPVVFAAADQRGQPRAGRKEDREPDPLVLVVDCADHTVTAELAGSLYHLIQGSAGRVRIVLLTRSDPPLPLHLYRLAGALAEIRAADLAFTPDEAAALMRYQKLELTPSEVAELQNRTDGWPAGLMFAAMGLAGKSDAAQAIRDFRGDAGNVAAYLMSEVLDAQPPTLREFLLRTCIVDEIRPALAQALTNRPCDLRSLEFMSHGNSFIQRVPGSDDRYTYQSLFREFLRTQLLYERPNLVRPLHRTAAAWFSQNGQRLEAIGHAVTARRWRDAAGYLVEGLDVGGLLIGRQRRLLAALFADLPDDLDGSPAAVVRAARALAEFDVARCTSELAKARASLDDEAPTPARASKLAIVMLEAVSASLGADVDVALDAALAAESALRSTAASPATTHPELRLLLAGCKGRVLLQRGDFAAALSAFAEGIEVAEAAGVHDALADLLGMAALVEAAWGHLRQATETASRATSLAETGAQPQEPQSAIVAQAWVRADQGDLVGAQEFVHRAVDAAPTHDGRVLAALLALVKARLLRADGDAELATAELRAASNSYGVEHDGWLSQSLVVDEAKTLVAQHRLSEAVSVIEHSRGRDQVGSLLVLQRAATEAGERGPALPPTTPRRAVSLDTQVEGWLVQAAESIRTGDPGRSSLCVERALRLAAPEHLRRPFSEAPASLQTLLQPTGDLMRRHPWLRAPGLPRGREQTATHASQRRTGVVVTSTLTSKEQEVLEYLAELLTTEEIASTMYVSVNTVRSHVRSILRKLSASRRNEAVRRAWELGLLRPHLDA